MRSLAPLALSLALACGCLDDAALVPPTVDEDPSLPALEVNGTRLHLVEMGRPGDPLVVFLHGGPGADFRQFLVWAPLADAGYHLVMYDQRGAGLSRRDRSETLSLPHALADLDAVIAAARAADEPVVLFGHSWGGMLATAYVNQDPARVAGAILAEPPGFTRAEAEALFRRSFEQLTFDEGVADILWTQTILSSREHARADYLFAVYSEGSNDAEGNDDAHPAPRWRWGASLSYWLPQTIGQFDFTTRLAEVTFPVLWFRSERNTLTDAAQQEAVAAHYPTVEMHLVPGVGHDLLYQRQAELAPLVLDYLARVTAREP